MSQTRIYIEGVALQAGERLRLPETAFRHLVQVLRLRSGDRFIAFDGRGGEYAAELVDVSKREASVSIGEFDPVDRESSLTLTLAQCVSKGERMDYTLQKAVELGVTRIVPLLSTRSVVKLDAERWDKKLEHWRGIIGNACEQSGRTRVPELAAVQPLGSWLSGDAQHGLRLTLDPLGAHGIRGMATPIATTSVTLLVGPEGGLSEAELQQAQKAGHVGVRMGPRVLRTETAGVAALAALQALWGDWQ